MTGGSQRLARFIPWVWKMAWRDGRTHRRRLFLFTTSIVLGVAALVSIGSFGQNLSTAVNSQAKTLLGADLMLSSLQPFSREEEALFDSLGHVRARETMFLSMGYFPKTGNSRLVQVRAVRGDFPFYGKLGSDPPDAATRYKTGPYALVDEALMLQYDARVGDAIRIGSQDFTIIGKLQKIPSEPPITSTFSPPVYVAAKFIDRTGLLQRGSLVTYRVYFRFDDGRDVQALVHELTPVFNRYRLRWDTVEMRKQRVGRILQNLYHFLNLVGFVALILGGIGVGSAVHVYTKQQLGNAAILRCVGAQSRKTFSIYLVQVATMALVGSLLGAGLGAVVQLGLPRVLGDFLPVTVATSVVWRPVAQGVLVGLALAMLFTLLPLLSLRKVSPLLALRASYDGERPRPDRLRWLVGLLIVVALTAFALSQTQTPAIGLGFAAAVLLAFGVLAATAKLLTVLLKRLFPTFLPYVWRQGLANLYRPNNQTLVLMLAVGLGTFLITTLYLAQGSLLQKIAFSSDGRRPNLVLFDVQPDQKDALADLLHSRNLPVLQRAPMVTMRIAKLKGTTAEEILNHRGRAVRADPSLQRVNNRLLRWEFRATYRDTLLDSEQLVAGEWVGHAQPDAKVIPVSLEQGAARRLTLAVGDTVVWDVQGVPLTTRVASLRKVDWQRIQANFMAVFPEGALEYAPQIYIFATRLGSAAESAALQRKVVERFPNVSIIDLGLVLSTLDTFLSKVSFVIQFMAFFSILTGLIVLAAAVASSRYQRVQESVLLRTLGASRKQVLMIMVVEYVFLGGVAAFSGLLLAYAGTWALTGLVFKTVFVPTLFPFVIVLAGVIVLTIGIGMTNSRGILDRPPLEVLRAEG